MIWSGANCWECVTLFTDFREFDNKREKCVVHQSAALCRCRTASRRRTMFLQQHGNIIF